jgi:two-component system NtrC family sensor kinase
LEQKPEDQATLLQQHKLISLGRLAASVVHEINNPLVGILNYLGLMIKILGRESNLDAENLTKFRRYLDLVEGEVRRCSNIMSNLLAFSRKSNLEFSEVDIDELLERCIILSQHKLDLRIQRSSDQVYFLREILRENQTTNSGKSWYFQIYSREYSCSNILKLL